MPFDEAQARQFDEAAEKALAELQEHIETWTARDLTSWWARWYLKAGHKRLGRILVAQSKGRNG
jgi:hypothetical protein